MDHTITTANATSPTVSWRGGKGLLVAQGTFGSGTLTAEASFDGGSNWITLADDAGDSLALTAEGMITFELPGCLLRAVLAGSTAATVGLSFITIRSK